MREGIRVICVTQGGELPNRIRALFHTHDAEVVFEPSIDRVLERFEHDSYDVLIISSAAFKAGKIDGIELVEVISVQSPSTQILFLADERDIKTAMSVLKAGSYQYAVTPIRDEELKLLIETAIEQRPRYGANLLLKKERKRVQFQELVGQAPVMHDVYRQIRQAAATDIPVLITGDTGTGKDLVASAIHNSSARAPGVYIPVNLGAIPPELVASELFGHEKGAFTGAGESREGIFERGNNGTVFLDEISAADEKVQVSLLRLIEKKRFHRLGGKKTVKTNARLVAASNEDLPQLVSTGHFREDLYFRMDVFHIVVPPLRERGGDIPLLVNEFLKRYNSDYNKNILGISPECISILERYTWPGNVRELKNVIQRAVLVCTGEVLLPEHLPPRFLSEAQETAKVVFDLGTSLSDVEREMIVRVLAATANNRKKSAEILGISRRALYNKIKRHGIA
jgi:DNA-binding NtrC family response regulator